MKVLELNTETVGLTLATYGVGMASGAMEAGALLRVINFGYAILLGPIMSVLAMVFMVATLQRPSPTPYCVDHHAHHVTSDSHARSTLWTGQIALTHDRYGRR